MVAFLASLVAFLAGVAILVFVGRRRPVGKPLSWGEAFVAATFVFGMMVLGYGILPHQWLQYADTDLQWRPDRVALGVSTAGVRFGEAAERIGGAGRILVSWQSVRDIVVSIIYAGVLAGQVIGWKWWQSRGQRRAEVEVTSVFGRPVMRES